MKGIVRADLQTFAATCAGGNEIIFRKGPWRPNEAVIFLPALCLKRVRFDHQGRKETKTKGTENIPPRKANSLHRLPTGTEKAEGDGLGRAFETFEAGDAVLLTVIERVLFRDGAYGAVLYTLQTLGAILADSAPINSKTGGEGKEGPQGTEIAAPEPFSDHSKGKGEDEENENEKVDLKDG